MFRKKVMLCLKPDQFSDKELHFALQYFHQESSVFTALFLKELSAQEVQLALGQSNGSEISVNDHVIQCKKQFRDIVLHEFQLPPQRLIFQRPEGASVKELLHDTRYADVLIISRENFLTNISYKGQTMPLSQALAEAQCLVLVVPAAWKALQEIMLIFDGHAASFAAIKKLVTAFPSLCLSLPTTLIVVQSKKLSLFSRQEEKMLIDYLKFHCHNLAVHKVCSASSHTIQAAMALNHNALLVINDAPKLLPPYLSEELSKLETCQLFNLN